LVTPSDHLIRDVQAYHCAALQAAEFAKQGYLVTFGVEPEYPETGFGYIQAEGSVVLAFKEKPDANTAASYIEQGGYYWNAGIFCFQAGVYLQELKRFAPDLHQAVMESSSLGVKLDLNQCYNPSLSEMLAMTDISIDYAVLEHSDKVRVVPCRMGWSDLGSFDALDAEFPKDKQGNTISNSADLALESRNNLLLNFSSQRVVIQGLDEVLLVNTEDSIYLGRKGQSQGLRDVVKVLQKENSPLLQSHREMMTTYGSLRLIDFKESIMMLELTFNEIPQQGMTITAQELLEHPLINHAWGNILSEDTIRCLALADSEVPRGTTNAVQLIQWRLELSKPCKILAILQRNS